MTLAACSTVPFSVEEGQIQISKFTDAIECELAAVAMDPKFAAFDVPNWGVKSQLDFTVVNSIGADGAVVWTIPHSAALIRLTPSFTVAHRNTNIGHLEFATSISGAAAQYGKVCIGPDPSGTGFGLASWFEATLLALKEGNSFHSGLSYTIEFQIVVAPAARFGYRVLLVDLNVGGGLSRTDTHRLTVALAPPPPPQKPPKPSPVYLVEAPGGAKLQPTERLAQPSERPRPRARTPRVSPPGVRFAPPTRDDPTLNRMLLQRAPVRIEQ
jgi:hypothetical protein